MATGQELQDQGTKLFMQRDYEAAQGLFTQAFDAYTAEGKPDMAAEMQVNLGLLDHLMEHSEEALDKMMTARAYFAGTNDRLREAQVMGNMGRVYLGMGNSEQAVTLYREAADIFRDLGDDEKYGETLLAMADIQIRERKFGQAMVSYEVALDSIKDLSMRQKFMKRLIGMKNSVMGGGAPPIEKPEEITVADAVATPEPQDISN